MKSFLSVGGSLSTLALACALLAGCGDGGGGGDTDGGGGPLDASGDIDARAGDDASAEDGSTPGEDGSTPGEDGSTPGDDASTPVVDGGGSMPDACIPPRCAPIPVGCDVVGGTSCTCGTIVCPPEPCSPACRRGQYCAYESTCGGNGTCAAVPDACPDVFDPVCGCDGMTYGNACEAAAAGESVASDGECAPDDCRTIGCRSGTCQECRGIGGAVWACIPDGAAC